MVRQQRGDLADDLVGQVLWRQREVLDVIVVGLGMAGAAAAIEAARESGLQVEGPLPPDTAFVDKRRSRTDAYICMYHDQGLIPLKALAFDKAVNVTLGLPIIRTSVDHGTALDIAWLGKADPTSLVQAVLLAVRLAERS